MISRSRKRSMSDTCSKGQTRTHLHPFLIVLLVQLLRTPNAEASLDSLRGGSLRVCTRNRWQSRSRSSPSNVAAAAAEVPDHAPLQFLEDITTSTDTVPNLGSFGRLPVSNSRRGGHGKNPTIQSLSVRTDVADLAQDFHAAIQAMNQDDNDIHVGRLLNACDRLEDTMEKIGFKQGAKDIGMNIRKIRNMYCKVPACQRDTMPALLRYEKEMGMHSNGIKDPSAAMGFLWLGRVLNYQYSMFKLMLDENEEPYDAARRAYDLYLKHHQSWAVQKVCQAAMTTLKPMKKTSVFSRFGGFEEDCFGPMEHDATNRDLYELMDCWQPLLNRWKKVFSDLNLGESI